MEIQDTGGDMHYWLHVICRAGGDTVDYFMQGGYMTGVAIFLIAVFLVRLKKGRQTMEEWIEDGMFGFWATVIWFGIYFVAHVLYFSPSAIYWEQNQAITDESNQVVNLTTQLRLAQNPDTGKIDQWQPPELDKRWDKVIVNYLPAQGVYEITNLSKAVEFEVNNSPWPQQFQGYHPFSSHVTDGRLYIDLEIPTTKKPVLIKDGEIIDLPEGWQWNANSNALEIVNAEVIPVFQEFFTNINTFIINGAVRSGDKVFFQDINHNIQCQDFQSGLYLDGEYATKLYQHFAYPAKDNPGVLFNK